MTAALIVIALSAGLALAPALGRHTAEPAPERDDDTYRAIRRHRRGGGVWPSEHIDSTWTAELAALHTAEEPAEQPIEQLDARWKPRPGTDDWWAARFAAMWINHDRAVTAAWDRAAREQPGWADLIDHAIRAYETTERALEQRFERLMAAALTDTAEFPVLTLAMAGA
jgi:hypothetical protein